MAGLNGRDVNVAFARGTTWGTAVNATRGINLRDLSGFDARPTVVLDDGFNQDFLGEGQIGDYDPTKAELVMDLRYDGAAPIWIAAACGSSAAPAVVSSQASGSLVAESHVITLALDSTKYFTFAADYGGAGAGTNFVLEVPSAKASGFSIKVGDNGKMELSVPIVGNKTVYGAAAVNTNSVIAAASTDALSGRVFRKHGVYRMNLQSAGSLVAGDAHVVTNVGITYARPLAEDDHVFGQDYIIEADDDGFVNIDLDLTFPRMTSANANSLVVAWPNGTHLKADMTFTGPSINSAVANDKYSLLIQFPALMISEWSAPVTGHGQVRPMAKAKALMATTAPTGMAGITAPMKITFINVNSSNLLV